MRDSEGAWLRRFGLALTWSVLDGPSPLPWSDDNGERETYAIRMMTVHAVEVRGEEAPWQPSRFDVRQESLWLMRHHLEAIELEKPRLYGGSAVVLLTAPPFGASDHTPLQAVEITVAHVPPAGHPEGDLNAFWSSTHLLRAREITEPLVLGDPARGPCLASSGVLGTAQRGYRGALKDHFHGTSPPFHGAIMRRKSSNAEQPATTCPSDGWFLGGKPLDLGDFGPSESKPNAWAQIAYGGIPAMSRDDLLAELERLDGYVLPAPEWVVTINPEAPHATLAAAGDPFDSMRDLVRLRALLPRIRFWLELGAQGSSTSASAAPSDLSAYASRLAELIMQIDGEAWRVAACEHFRASWRSSDASWRQAEGDFRAELERRLRDVFLHCLTRVPRAADIPAASLTVAASRCEVAALDHAEQTARTAESIPAAES